MLPLIPLQLILQLVGLGDWGNDLLNGFMGLVMRLVGLFNFM